MQMQNETHFFFFSGKVPASPYDQVFYSQPSQRSNDDPEKSYFPIS